MRQLNCPVCGEGGQKEIKNFSLVHCRNCGVSWTLVNEDLDTERLYEDQVYAVVDNRKSIFEKIIFRESKRIIATVNRLLKHQSKIRCLDFGSGKGQFLYQAKKAGWMGKGIETAHERAQFAREKYGLDIETGYYHGGQIGKEIYDVITLFHVLEHLPAPMELVREICNKNLRSNGLLVIEVPNLHSWQSNIAGMKWMHLDIPKHLSHWNEKLLTKKVNALGFKKVRSQYFSLHLGVLGSLSAILGKFGYQGNIIYDLKNRKSFTVFAGIILVLPVALLLEVVSLPFRKSGIVRLYFKKI
jgi:2-polyprenyl-3-methyl-5-hydroxy-6-metoxy-1,4-benzoquinol methylase